MKWVLWLVGLFAMAVAGAFIAGHNEGTVTLFWPPYRFDMSLNLVVLLGLLGFGFVHFVLRGAAMLLDLPKQARRWRMLQKERAMHATMLDALAFMLTGRYVRSRKAAQQALQMEQDLRENLRLGERLPRHLVPLRIMCQLVAAESAHVLRDQTARDQHLSAALAIESAHPQLSEFIDAARLCAARWTLGDRDAGMALKLLADLPHGLGRRTLALRLRLKASRLVHNHGLALETARLLSKHGAFSDAGANSLMRSLALSSLHEARDTDQLQKIWQGLTQYETGHFEVARMAAMRWMQLGGGGSQAIKWLLPQWQAWLQRPDAWTESERTALTVTLEHLIQTLPPDVEWLHRLEQAIQIWPQQPELQYLGGVVFMRHCLWGKAQQAFERGSPKLSQSDLRRRAWAALAELAEQRGDAPAAAHCWKKSAQTSPDPSEPKG